MIKIHEDSNNKVEKASTNHLIQIRFFECGKPDHILANYIHKQKHMNKYAIKSKVTISNSTSSNDEDDSTSDS